MMNMLEYRWLNESVLVTLQGDLQLHLRLGCRLSLPFIVTDVQFCELLELTN